MTRTPAAQELRHTNRKEPRMPTSDEIERRVQQNDTSRSAHRAAAAQQVGELAERRAAIAEQLREVERQLGDVLAEASAVMDVDELARFTDVPAADLTGWLTSRTTTRPKRKKAPTSASGTPAATPRSTASRTPPTSHMAPTVPEPAAPHRGAPDTSTRVPAPAP